MVGMHRRSYPFEPRVKIHWRFWKPYLNLEKCRILVRAKTIHLSEQFYHAHYYSDEEVQEIPWFVFSKVKEIDLAVALLIEEEVSLQH